MAAACLWSVDFIRKGSADLYHSATPRLYKEQLSPRSITVGLLLTSDLYLSQPASFPHHKHHVLYYSEATFSNWGLSAQRMEQEKEDGMNIRWVGSTRINNYGAIISQTSANLLPATVYELWSAQEGLFISRFFFVPSCFLYLWVMRSEFD